MLPDKPYFDRAAVSFVVIGNMPSLSTTQKKRVIKSLLCVGQSIEIYNPLLEDYKRVMEFAAYINKPPLQNRRQTEGRGCLHPLPRCEGGRPKVKGGLGDR